MHEEAESVMPSRISFKFIFDELLDGFRLEDLELLCFVEEAHETDILVYEYRLLRDWIFDHIESNLRQQIHRILNLIDLTGINSPKIYLNILINFLKFGKDTLVVLSEIE